MFSSKYKLRVFFTCDFVVLKIQLIIDLHLMGGVDISPVFDQKSSLNDDDLIRTSGFNDLFFNTYFLPFQIFLYNKINNYIYTKLIMNKNKLCITNDD